MYLLSFLLTADHDKAEQCLVSTIGEARRASGFSWIGGYPSGETTLQLQIASGPSGGSEFWKSLDG